MLQWTLGCMCQNSGGKRDREQTYGHRRGRRGWDESREKHLNIYITVCKIWEPVEVYCMMQGAQIQGSVAMKRGGYGERWEGCSRGRRHTCDYGWFMLIYDRNKHNFIKWYPIMKVNTFFKIKIKKYYAVWKFINRIEAQIKTSLNKQKLKYFITTKLTL